MSLFINILSLLLIPMTIISYIPQYHRLLTLGSSAGISITSVLITTLLSQVQIFTMWFLFKLAPTMEYNIPIATPTSTRDWLNMTQICVQWICSLFLFILIIFLPTSKSNDSAPSGIVSKMTAVFILLAYISLSIILSPAGAPIDDLAFYLMANLHTVIANYAATFLLSISFFFQIRLISTDTEPNALSQWTLGLQALVFALLAVSWPFRLILPPNVWERGNKPALLMAWYPWVGWACVNSVIMAIGQGVTFLISVKKAGNGIVLVGEQEALLVRT